MGMDTVNRNSDVDYSSWETPNKAKPQPRRWCPTHRRLEHCEPGERLRCGLAWRDQYVLEREAASASIDINSTILALGNSISTLAESIQNGERVVAEPLPRPVPQPPRQPRPQQIRNTGKGGVALP